VSVLLWICGKTTLEQNAKKNGLTKIWHYDAAKNKWTYHQNHSDNTNNVGGQPSGRLTQIQPNKTYWIQSPRYQVISRAGGINSVKYYIHNNHLGSEPLTTDVNGIVKQGAEYLPYGAPANAQDSKLQPYGFSAKERDASELMYFEARYYDPLSTRFISPDPLFAAEIEKCIESIVECNLYQYTGNNPVNFVDPDGELALHVIAAIAGGVVGAIAGGVTEAMSQSGPVDWGRVGSASVGGAISGAGAVAGPLVSSLLSIAGEGVKQTINIVAGSQDGYNKKDFISAGVSILGGEIASRAVKTGGKLMQSAKTLSSQSSSAANKSITHAAKSSWQTSKGKTVIDVRRAESHQNIANINSAASSRLEIQANVMAGAGGVAGGAINVAGGESAKAAVSVGVSNE
jgi:RHS repeat-associated protein